MRRLLLLLLPLVLPAAEDAREIVCRAVEADSQNWDRARNYTWIQYTVRRNVESSGKTTSEESQTHEVTMLYGQPFNKLIARNGRPLQPKEARQVQEKFDNLAAERARETPEQRESRMADYAAHRRRQREYFREVLDAFDFKLLGDAKVNGFDAWKIEATPRPGYKPRSPQAARIFPKVKGVLWIDKARYQWVKADAESIETISFGGIFARISKGAHFQLEQNYFNGDVWLPIRMSAAATARILLVKRIGVELEVTYRDYRKFQADSRVVTEPEADSSGAVLKR